MAGAADKKQAQRNTETLASVHKLSAIVNVLAILCVFVLRRPRSGKLYFIFFSIPALFCQYTVEKVGRPKYTTNSDGYKVLVRAGEDLQQAGLTEYMFDIIYLTLLIDILMCLFGSMKVWWILLVVPGFAAWKLKGIVGTVLGMFLPSLRGGRSGGQSATTDATGEADGAAAGKSKRQLKMEKRGNKQKVRYRWSRIPM